MALNIKDLGVKFYSSKTKSEAIALASLPGSAAEPGAICFVSDNTGNYIILDGKIFSGGNSSGGGAVELSLSNIPVVVRDGVTIKTLQDYFTSDGDVISESFKVVATRYDYNNQPYNVDVITIDSQGIRIGNETVSTQEWVNGLLTNNNTYILREAGDTAQTLADTAEQNAKDYADSILGSIYTVKGSVDTYEDLALIPSPNEGDIYNVINAQGTEGTPGYVPPGTNYVFIADQNASNVQGGHWDQMGGTTDLTNYYDKTEINLKISQAIQSANSYADGLKSTIDGNITTLTNSINTLGNTVATNSTNISTNTTNISTNTTNINNLATQLTWQ